MRRMKTPPTLTGRLGLVNESPYDDGWMFRLRPEPDSMEEAMENLLNAEAYREICEEQED